MSGRNAVASDAVSARFVEIIRQELEKREMSAYAFAKLLGVRPQSVNAVLAHPGRVQSNTIVQWFAALGLEPQLLAKKKRTNGNAS